MRTFNDANDVEEWLAPLSYAEFWDEVAPFALVLQDRTSCDEQIHAGTVDEETVLFVLKGMARLELIERLRLRPRKRIPWQDLI